MAKKTQTSKASAPRGTVATSGSDASGGVGGSRFTPGTWRVSDGASANSYRHEIETTTPRGARIVLARVATPNRKPEQATANARLFAAAPDLHDAVMKQASALTACARYFLGSGPQPDPEDLGDAIAAGDAVLAKAEGR